MLRLKVTLFDTPEKWVKCMREKHENQLKKAYLNLRLFPPTALKVTSISLLHLLSSRESTLGDPMTPSNENLPFKVT